MSFERGQLFGFAAGHFPKNGGLVAAAGSQPMIVRGKSQRFHRGLMPLQSGEFLGTKSGQVPKPDKSFKAAASRCQDAIPRSESHGMNFLRLGLQYRLFTGFAAAQVPQSDG